MPKLYRTRRMTEWTEMQGTKSPYSTVGISSQAPTSAANLVYIFTYFSPKNENPMKSPDTKMSTWHQ